MKGKIDKYGHLYIIRVRAEIAQFCPLHDNDLDGRLHVCGDWCPLFGEPYTERVDPTNGLDRRMEATGQTVLMLCHSALIFDEFTDEREETNDHD